MSVVVAYKYTSNPQDASVNSDGTLDWSRAKSAVSEYDTVAMQLGHNLATELGTEVVGVSVGGADLSSSLAKKAAMSRGLARGVVLSDDDTANWSMTKIASAIAALVKRVDDAQIVVAGDSSVDEGAKLTSALIGGFLGWPTFQSVVAVKQDGDAWEVTQIAGSGKRTVRVAGPIVVAVTSDAVEPLVPAMKDILMAGRKPVEVVAAADLELSGATAPVAETSKPEKRVRKHELFKGDDAAEQLAAALKSNGVL
jgi:electron transfer flavoprotein beta subunit